MGLVVIVGSLAPTILHDDTEVQEHARRRRYVEEAHVCLCLYKACQASIDMGCAIAF